MFFQQIQQRVICQTASTCRPFFTFVQSAGSAAVCVIKGCRVANVRLRPVGTVCKWRCHVDYRNGNHSSSYKPSQSSNFRNSSGPIFSPSSAVCVKKLSSMFTASFLLLHWHFRVANLCGFICVGNTKTQTLVCPGLISHFLLLDQFTLPRWRHCGKLIF